MLTRQTFTGPWAGLPVAWTDDDKFDEATYRGDVARCCETDVPGFYTGGTTGEFYAMELDEFQAVARATVEECHAGNKPAMIGCSSTYTLGAQRRAAFAAEIGADAIQVALPFWMEIGSPQIVAFFQQVSEAAGGMPLSIYETTRSKVALTLEQHRAIHADLPNYLMVKANDGTIGAEAQGCAALSEIVNVFVGEGLWASLGPHGANGCCSAFVYWNPRICLALWKEVEAGNWDAVNKTHERLSALFDFLGAQFAPRGFHDTAYDRMGGVASGFLKTSLHNRGPYPSATQEDVQLLRDWYSQHYPEMLEL